MTMIDGVEFGVFPEWVALPLNASAEDLAASLLDRFADDSKPEQAKVAIAAGLAALRSEIAASSDDRMQIFTTWVLVPRGGKAMNPLAAAFGAIVRVTRGTTPMEFVETLIDGAPLHQPVDLQTLATPLGEAHVIRGRTYAKDDHGIKLSELVSVFWLPADDDIAVMISSLPLEDLILAADVADAMIGLAETAEAMSTGDPS